jgi:hypothetical protein
VYIDSSRAFTEASQEEAKERKKNKAEGERRAKRSGKIEACRCEIHFIQLSQLATSIEDYINTLRLF